MTSKKTGARRIADERKRQIEVKGYDVQGDCRQIVPILDAAYCYAVAAIAIRNRRGLGDWDTRVPWHQRTDKIAEKPREWPWEAANWNPESDYDPKPALVKAGALIAAALDAMIEEEKTSPLLPPPKDVSRRMTALLAGVIPVSRPSASSSSSLRPSVE